jgi:omega-6 fatty acid desaturase (delta-12 desaturase)
MSERPLIDSIGSHREDVMPKDLVAPFQRSSAARARWQLVNSLLPYVLLWVAMVQALAISYWLMLPLAVVAAGFLARIFIIFHDCGHSSFFKSRKANNATGAFTGLLNLTPYRHWRWQHALHHGSSGNLDRRGTGDIWTLTVEEYSASSRWRRLTYRLARNPFVLFVIAPLSSMAPLPERRSVRRTNVALILATLLMSAIIGFKTFLIIQLTVSALAGTLGLWLFYVQHQFEGAYWERSKDWDYIQAALQGSSFYKLPRVLQWFTGNIGYHHIHHLNPRVPNYFLQQCHEAQPRFREVRPITLLTSLRALTYRLWDEQRKVFVGYRRRTCV